MPKSSKNATARPSSPRPQPDGAPANRPWSITLVPETVDENDILRRKSRPRTHKESARLFEDTAADANFAKFEETLMTLAKDFSNKAQSTLRRYAFTISRFESYVASSGRWPEFIGREFDFEQLVERITGFLTVSAEVSQSRIPSATTERMSAGSLRSLAQDMFSIAIDVVPELTRVLAARNQFAQAITKAARLICHTYDLSTRHLEKPVFHERETRLLNEGALVGSKDFALGLQFSLTCVVALLTGLRPSSMFTTIVYRDSCIPFEDWKILRLPQQGCFAVRLTVRNFKGANDPFYARSQEYTMMPVSTDGELLLDPGILTIALCLQRGDLADHDTWESLVNGEEQHIRFHPDRLKKPFLQAGTPGGWALDPAKALDAAGFRKVLRKVCVAVGLGGSEKHNSPYIFRRGNASVSIEVYGAESTRVLFGHKQNTDVLYDHYNTSIRRLDLTAGQLQGVKKSTGALDALDAPALFRIPPPAPESRITAAEALKLSATLRNLDSLRKHIREALESVDSTACSQLRQNIPEEDMKLLEEHVVDPRDDEAVIMRFEQLTTNRYRRALANIRATLGRDDRISQYEKPLVAGTIEQRAEEFAAPSSILDKLKALSGDSLEDIDKDCFERYSLEDQVGLICNDGKGGVRDTPDSFTARRVDFIRILSTYKLPNRGPQICPYCFADTTLEASQRERLYRSASYVARHISVHHERKEGKKREESRLGHLLGGDYQTMRKLEEEGVEGGVTKSDIGVIKDMTALPWFSGIAPVSFLFAMN